jgi:hypothetical protein
MRTFLLIMLAGIGLVGHEPAEYLAPFDPHLSHSLFYVLALLAKSMGGRLSASLVDLVRFGSRCPESCDRTIKIVLTFSESALLSRLFASDYNSYYHEMFLRYVSRAAYKSFRTQVS